MNRQELIEILFILDNLITKFNKKIKSYEYKNTILTIRFEDEENCINYVLDGGNDEKEN